MCMMFSKATKPLIKSVYYTQLAFQNVCQYKAVSHVNSIDILPNSLQSSGYGMNG